MLQYQIALKHFLPVLSVGPSSTGRVAFTESGDTVLHSLLSSSFMISAATAPRQTQILSPRTFGAGEGERGFRVLTLV